MQPTCVSDPRQCEKVLAFDRAVLRLERAREELMACIEAASNNNSDSV
jgi:hypothetical protein